MELLNVKGVAETRLKQLESLGITGAQTLLGFAPKRYVDMQTLPGVSACADGEMALVRAIIQSAPRAVRSRTGRRYIAARASDGAKTFNLMFFNAPFVLHALKEGEEYVFYGRASVKRGYVTLFSPTFERAHTLNRLKGLMPVYALRGSMAQGVFSRIVRECLASFDVKSVVPDEEGAGLIPLKYAYAALHLPKSEAQAQEALERVALERFLASAVQSKILGLVSKAARSQSYGDLNALRQSFQSILPYKLTDGQDRAISDIIADLSSEKLMNRLLQGDVGCGKTAVAVFALYAAAASGFQAALLAPTEVLCQQHYRTLSNLLLPLGVRCVCLTGGARERKTLLGKLESGEAEIAIGTHALLSPDVKFRNLRLIAVDEQQRFGVAQRAALEQKSQAADVLSMSATPIPRTLSLSLYGGLNKTEIHEKPAGRAEVLTRIVPEERQADMFEFIAERAKAGSSAYIVCPLIYGEDDELTAAQTLYENLSKNVLKDVPCGLLHGSMSAAKKQAALTQFSSGETRVLVSTTVIEVGMDVPEADIMCIMGAQRFGLSQLHQLRGRVGRGTKQSWCFLCANGAAHSSHERLKALTECSDGFELADRDLSDRGAGDFMGRAQSGGTALPLTKAQIASALEILDKILLTPEYIEHFRSVTKNLPISPAALS